MVHSVVHTALAVKGCKDRILDSSVLSHVSIYSLTGARACALLLTSPLVAACFQFYRLRLYKPTETTLPGEFDWFEVFLKV